MVKADIFDHPVSFSQETTVMAESPEEALSASLNRYGGVNPVSYTHLDVYKRQEKEKGRGRAGCPRREDGRNQRGCRT